MNREAQNVGAPATQADIAGICGADPLAAEKWIYGIEETFVAMEYPEEVRLNVALPLLIGNAKHWWDSVKPAYNDTFSSKHPKSSNARVFMEKGKSIESMDDEHQLPEVIIQHIQSFLNRRQAARTSVLSKSWYSAWSTRPILNFDEGDFQIAKVFSEFVKRTMQRYHELKLKIEDFRLQIQVIDSDSAPLADESITRALQLRVNDFSLEISGGYWKYVLPVQVFEAKSLINLSVVGCKIDQEFNGNMICSNLLSLTLCRVFIGDDMIRDIVLRCPLLENLHLSECMGLLNVNDRLFAIESRQYGKLSCLMLERVKINDFFFHDFSLKFPCLEDLSLHDCDGYKDIDIFSHSLKYISLMHTYKLKKAKFEVPSIRKFEFSAINIPSMCFMTASREYESYISLTCRQHHAVGGSWFLALKKFLTELSRSKISLKIQIFLDSWDYCMGDNRGFPVPLVENLKVKVYPSSSLCYAVLDCLFWSCRPKFITIYDDDDIETRMLLCKLLVQQVIQDRSYSTREFSYMNDLGKVNVESFEETLKEWQPLPWQDPLDFLNVEEVNEEQFRFRLKWRAS
ncbi:hypothetical protein BUALT_Bualt14G0085300 [Buddleja alternifolia]|uniref:Uncharacterized protein n=1 Tax=Buddleja alternifolia TaxID=168488 RepID=A0AAV6WQN2_9LAMI|nr:hypothetical protein BUALT_Bualt14G0085300 [Buddleja alternifolia]